MNIEKTTHKIYRGEGEEVVFVSLLLFIIPNNLFGRESYRYRLVHMVKFVIWEEI